ncbi:MAG: hypothetical protein VR72_03000 [Clostridiaceae bacterium BRH_c20a]|nr:MAG: hypothetical protein VR72_03000 [Clostridiaceae bacterium BRH_c20a]
MARRKQQRMSSGGYEIGRLVEQSGGMVDDVVYPTLLSENEAHKLINNTLEEKGTVKPCKGRQERFAAPFDENNPVNGIGVFYKSDGTTRLVMAAGSKLYSDTPHVVTSYDSKDDWDSGTKSKFCDTSNTPGDLTSLGSIIGDAGNCEDETQWTAVDAALLADDTKKKYDDKSLKITINSGKTVGFAKKLKSALTVDNTKLHVLSAYVVNGNAGTGIRLVTLDANNAILKSSSYVTATSDFAKLTLKLTASEVNAAVAFAVEVKGSAAQYAWADGIILKQITQAEYDDSGYTAPNYDDLEGIDKVQTVTSQADWEAGTLENIDTTTSAGDIKLAKSIPDFNDTFNSQVEWEEGTNSDVSTSASAGDVLLSKEGTDFSETDTLTGDFNGTHSNTEAVSDAVELVQVASSRPALNYDGTNDMVQVADSGSLDFGTGNFTIEGKIKLSSINKVHSIVSKGQAGYGSSYKPVFDFRVINTNKLDIHIEGSSSIYSVSATGSTSLSLDTVYHVACVRDGANVYVYLNGIQDGSAIDTDIANVNNSYPLYIGAIDINGTLSRFLHGAMYEVRAWNIARTQQEIYDNMNNELLGNEPGLVGYWECDEGSGSTVNDTTANNNDGTISGATWTTVGSTEYSSSGTYTHNEQIVAEAGVANAATITFNKTTPTNTTLMVEINVFDGSTWSGWATKNSGDTIIPKGTDLMGYKVQWRANLATTVTTVTPSLDDVTVSVTSAYKVSGIWTSPIMNSNAVNNGTTTLTSTAPAGTSITQEFKTSADNVTWSDWSPYSGAITAANYVQFRLLFATTDVALTPSASELVISFTGQYTANGTWMGVVFDVSDINPESSTISWIENLPAGTSITVETRGSYDNSNWGNWEAQTKDAAITTINFYNQARVKLNSNVEQTETPTVSELILTVKQDGKRAIWISPIIDASQASDKSTGHISVTSTPGEGNVITQSRSSANNGSTWGAWVDASVDGNLNHTPNNHVQNRFIYTKDASIQLATISFDGIPSAVELYSGLNPGGECFFTTLLDSFLVFNGIDAPKKWDGTNAVEDLGGSPPRAIYIANHKNRLFAAHSGTSRSRLYFSDVLALESWPVLNFIDISPNDGDFITGLLPYDDYLIITKQRSVWVLLGSQSADFEVRRIHDGLGNIAPRALVKVNELFSFVSTEGLYVSDLSKPLLLTERIKNTWSNLNRRRLTQAAAEFFDHKIRLDVPNGSSTVNDFRIVYDVLRKAIVLEQFNAHASCYTKFVEAGQEELLYGHAGDGQVSKGDIGTTDAGDDIVSTWGTKHFNFGSSATEKKIRRLRLVLVKASTPVDIEVYLVVNNVKQPVPLMVTIPASDNAEEATIELSPRDIDVRKIRALGYEIVQRTSNGGVKFHELLQEYRVGKVRKT